MSAAIEILAAVCGLAGTLLLALRGPRAGWGFVFYLVSNAGWLWFAIAHGHWPLLVQQLGFTATSVLGIWVWLMKVPPLATCDEIWLDIERELKSCVDHGLSPQLDELDSRRLLELMASRCLIRSPRGGVQQ